MSVKLAYVVGVYENRKKYRVLLLVGAGSRYGLRDIYGYELVRLLENGVKIENTVVDSGKLKLTQGAVTAYPVLGESGNVLNGKSGLTVLYKVADKKGTVLGYGVCTERGEYRNISKDALIRVGMEKKLKATNWMIYTEDGMKYHVRAKSGEFPVVEIEDVKRVYSVTSGVESADAVEKKKVHNERVSAEITAEQYAEKPVGIYGENRERVLPYMHVFNLDSCYENEYNTDVQKKIAMVMGNLMLLSPYYAWALEIIPKIPVMPEDNTKYGLPGDFETMAVSATTLYYSVRCIMDRTVGELSFIFIHELSHLIHQHSIRHGTRDNVLWNVACDLYINELVMREFDMCYGDMEKQLLRPSFRAGNAVSDGKTYKCVIKEFEDGVFLSTINETLDFSVDTVEKIYDKLLEENKQSSSDGSGKKQESSHSGQGNSQDVLEGGQTDKSDKNNNDDLSKAGQNVKCTDSEDGTEGSGTDGGVKVAEVDVTYNGKRIKGKISLDIIADRDMEKENAAEQSLRDTKEMLEKIKIKIENGKRGDPTGCFDYGLGSADIDRTIEYALSVRYNWKQILKGAFKEKPYELSTYTVPNESYLTQGITLPTRIPMGTPTRIKGLKICVDASGSLSDKQLGVVYGEIEGLLKACGGKVDAEIMYWDAEVVSCGAFKDINTLKKVPVKGGGGTDVSCVFEYLLGNTEVNGRKQKLKTKDITMVVFFTDGYFAHNYMDYAEKFGRKVLWVIDEKSAPFTPLYGRVAVARLS